MNCRLLVVVHPSNGVFLWAFQAARVWRDGQKKRVFVYRFLTTGTIEEKVPPPSPPPPCRMRTHLHPYTHSRCVAGLQDSGLPKQQWRLHVIPFCTWVSKTDR